MSLDNIEKAKILQNSDIEDKEAKAIGVLGAVLGASNESIIHGMIAVSDHNTTEKAESETPKPQKPKDYTKTESVLHDMLIENTGVAMMDSGGMYGRAWQQNRAITDFRLLEPIAVSMYGTYKKGDMPSIHKNLFHLLVEHLEYDATMNRRFTTFANAKKRRTDYINSVIEEFTEKYHYGNYPEKPVIDNSYNSENTLSQDMQYAIFSNDDIDYVILQIHGGCDIRGGYTDPKVFKLTRGWDYFLLSFVDLNASCDCEGLTPYSDDAGYHWYDTGNDDKDHSLPNVWSWSERLKGLYCRDCKHKVRFS